MADPTGTAGNNRPTVAAAVTGAVTGLAASLAHWLIAVLPEVVPGDVRAALLAALTLAGVLIGAAAGKVAQRHTWAETTVLDRQADWWASGFTAARRATATTEPDPDAADDLASGKPGPLPDPIYPPAG